MFGRLYWGKKQPALTYCLAANLSKDPIMLTKPSGSIQKEIDGLAIWWLKQVGEASMMPPTLQKEAMYSAQLLKRVGIAIIAFLGSCFANMGLSASTRSISGSSCFFFRVWIALMLSTFKYACPRPLNSSSILKIQIETYRFLAISWARL